MKEKILITTLTILLIGGLAISYYVARLLAPEDMEQRPDPSVLLPATVGPQTATPTPIPLTSDSKNYVIVAPSGGNFTRLSTALDNIRDASAENRYVIIVRGTIVENGNLPGVQGYIDAKSHIDVIGQGATLELWAPERTGKDYAVQFLDVFDSEWRDLNIVAKEVWNQIDYEYSGDSSSPLVDIGIGTQYVINIRGKTDKTLRLVNINTFWDWQAGTTAFQHGGIIKDLASPTITNSSFKGGPWEHSVGLIIGSKGSPIITNSRFTGGGGAGAGHAANNYGLILENGTPMVISSVAEGGLGDFHNHAIYIAGGQPTLIGVVGKPQEFSYTFTYDAANPTAEGRFIPEVGRDLRYLVRNISISFAPQKSEWTLKVGTTPGGSELIDIFGSGNLTRPYQNSFSMGNALNAGDHIYISTTGINDNVYVKYTVMPASGKEGYITAGLFLAETRANITWSIFYGTWEWNPPLAFAPEAGRRPRWQITGSSFIQLWEKGGGLAAYSAMNYFGKLFDMPVYYSTFEGDFYNVRLAEYITLPGQSK